MRWTDEMRIETPEQIEVDLELAGLGSRFLAQAFDWLLKGVASVLLLLLALLVAALLGKSEWAESPPKLVAAVVVAGLYLVWLGTGLFFEVRWNGQTPGKRLAGVRVIREGGAPIDFQSAGIRNLLAIADFLPALMIFGALLVLLTPRRQRLGDLAAGTIVVRERTVDLGADPTDALTEHSSPEYSFSPGELAAVTAADRALLREFLRRYPTMSRDGKEQLAWKLADRYRDKTGTRLSTQDFRGSDARAFLASLLRDLENLRRHA